MIETPYRGPLMSRKPPRQTPEGIVGDDPRFSHGVIEYTTTQLKQPSRHFWEVATEHDRHVPLPGARPKVRSCRRSVITALFPYRCHANARSEERMTVRLRKERKPIADSVAAHLIFTTTLAAQQSTEADRFVAWAAAPTHQPTEADCCIKTTKRRRRSRVRALCSQ